MIKSEHRCDSFCGCHSQVVQGDDGSDHAAKIEDEQFVVGGDREWLLAIRAAPLEAFEVGEKIEDVLEVVDDLVVHWHLSRYDGCEVVSDLCEVGGEAAERRQPICDPGREGASREILDVPEQMLDPNLFGFFSLYRRRNVHEGLLCCRAVLWMSGAVTSTKRREAGIPSQRCFR